MFDLSVEASFSAAHFIDGYSGECANLHGHNYVVQAVVKFEKLNNIGLGIDFKVLRKELKGVLKPLDHTNLNESPIFKNRPDFVNPTAETLSKHVFAELEKRLKGMEIRLYKIVLTEAPGLSVAYCPDQTI